MKKFLFLSIVLSLSTFRIGAQCDSLLIPGNHDFSICQGEWFKLKFDSLTHRKGGTWHSKQFGFLWYTYRTENYRPNLSQYFIYRYTDSLTNCKAEAQFYVQLIDTPSVNIQKPNDACSNDKCYTLNLFASPFGGEWYGRIPGTEKGEFCPDQVYMTGLKQNSADITYRYTGPITTCTTRATTSVTVKAVPDIQFLNDTIMVSKSQNLLNMATALDSSISKSGTWTGQGIIERNDTFYFSRKRVNSKLGFYKVNYHITEDSGTTPYCTNEKTLVLQLTDSLVTALEREPPPGVFIYPNPSNGLVFISSKKPTDISVYHVSGAFTLRSQVISSKTEIRLKQGMYIVVNDSAMGKEIKRLVVN